MHNTNNSRYKISHLEYWDNTALSYHNIQLELKGQSIIRDKQQTNEHNILYRSNGSFVFCLSSWYVFTLLWTICCISSLLCHLYPSTLKKWSENNTTMATSNWTGMERNVMQWNMLYYWDDVWTLKSPFPPNLNIAYIDKIANKTLAIHYEPNLITQWELKSIKIFNFCREWQKKHLI